MKTIALMVTLALHTTGLWPHLSAHTRTALTHRTTSIGAAAQPSATAKTVAMPLTALPIRTTTTPLSLNAASAIAIDRTTATTLYAKNSGAKRPIASVTKLITALVILSRHSPSERITIPTLPEYPVEAETIGLKAGDTFRLGDILEAALVPSANDAADALAIYDAGSVTKFAARMNLKMHEWGIDDTRFVSASGLQDTGNYASAASLAKIASLALINPTLASTVTHTSATITSGQGRVYNLTTTNELLASGKFYGIKTGYTLAAGECFVGITRVNGHEVITVVLGADSRFGATTTLTNWIGQNWQWL
jgi:serine-type D-Ala-D-Ala carboxypeptidase (penicillin-binding protein 5/6)